MGKKLLRIILLVPLLILFLHMIILLWTGLYEHVQPASAIIVFGNKVETSGIPSNRLKSRLDQAVVLFYQNMAPKIVVSGGLGKEGFYEAEVMKDYLVNQGIPSEDILVDNYGTTTFATAVNCRKLFHPPGRTNVILVSQYYHLLRARLAFRKSGYQTVYSSYGRMFPELRDLYSIPREIVGYYYYLIRDYT